MQFKALHEELNQTTYNLTALLERVEISSIVEHLSKKQKKCQTATKI